VIFDDVLVKQEGVQKKASELSTNSFWKIEAEHF
jgi:hypothetical protein